MSKQDEPIQYRIRRVLRRAQMSGQGIGAIGYALQNMLDHALAHNEKWDECANLLEQFEAVQ